MTLGAVNLLAALIYICHRRSAPVCHEWRICTSCKKPWTWHSVTSDYAGTIEKHLLTYCNLLATEKKQKRFNSFDTSGLGTWHRRVNQHTISRCPAPKGLIRRSHLSSSSGPPCVLPNGLKCPPALVQPKTTTQSWSSQSYKDVICDFLPERHQNVQVFAIAYPSVVCNIHVPYSGGWNFPQYFFAVLYLSQPPTSVQNFTEIIQGEPLRREH